MLKLQPGLTVKRDSNKSSKRSRGRDMSPKLPVGMQCLKTLMKTVRPAGTID